MAAGADETTASLTGSLARLGARLVVETLPYWLAGVIRPQPQDESQATWSRPLTKEDGAGLEPAAATLDRQVEPAIHGRAPTPGWMVSG